ERLKAPDELPVLTGLQLLSVAQNGPNSLGEDVGTSALLLTLPADDLPHPLPASWRVVRRSTHAAMVLVVMRSRIDWSRFEVCARSADGPEQPCVESGMRRDDSAPGFTVRNMPPSERRARGTLKLRLPLRPAAPGSTDEIFM